MIDLNASTSEVAIISCEQGSGISIHVTTFNRMVEVDGYLYLINYI